MTTGGKVLIHQPFVNDPEKGAGLEKQQEITFLNTNKDIVSLEAGALDPEKPYELLFMGTKTNLLVYDVQNNTDIFDKEVNDGLNCMAFGYLQSMMPEPLIVTGGNCSITGFDLAGEEKFWTVTGDNARCVEFIDWDEDTKNELIVGSDDFAIRVFKDEELIFDLVESAKLLFLRKIKNNIFGFALNNGTYGVYYSRKRLWFEKKQDKVTSIVGMDFGFDNQMQLVIGFESGLIEVRRHRTGELIDTQQLSTAVSGLFYYDYRQQGSKQLLALDRNGSVRGF